MQPIVSVVIPVRDMEDTLGAQLAALSRQDITDPFEVVVIDNGSRDRSIAVAEGWQDRLVLRVLRSPGRADAGRARNIGAAAAVADRLVFCDADDEVRPNWLRAMVRALHVAPVVAGPLDHSRINAPWAIFRLRVKRGGAVAQLFKAFRHHGMPRSSLAELAYDYLSIPLNLLRGRPLLAAQAAGWRVGRLIGSVRMGVFFP